MSRYKYYSDTMIDTIAQLWTLACKSFGADEDKLHTRQLDCVFAKQALWKILHDHGWSDRQIAKEMGFDLSTICHGRLSAESSLKYIKGYKERYQELERRCEDYLNK